MASGSSTKRLHDLVEGFCQQIRQRHLHDHYSATGILVGTIRRTREKHRPDI